jgi:MoaD family protein
MSVVFRIPVYLRAFTEGQKRVALDAEFRLLRDALDSLAKKYPGVRDRVLTETGEVRPHVNIFVGAESVRYTGGLDTPIRDGEEISIVPAVSGGSGHQLRTISV